MYLASVPEGFLHVVRYSGGFAVVRVKDPDSIRKATDEAIQFGLHPGRGEPQDDC